VSPHTGNAVSGDLISRLKAEGYIVAGYERRADLRSLLEMLTPTAREHLRDVLIRDQADRDEISSRLMRYRDQNGQDWADIIDFLTMYPDARRRVVRVLGEIDAR
jgi:hypothetical protein